MPSPRVCCVWFASLVACGSNATHGGGDATGSTTTAASTTALVDGTASSGDDTVATASTGDASDDPLAAWCGVDAATVEARIDGWLAELSVAEKVAMMHGTGLLPTDGTWQVAGDDVRGIPGLHMLDGPRGVSDVSGVTATVFPVPMMRGATWDPALEREVGAAIAREIRSVGADVVLAPTMNVLRHPRWGRAQETYGEDTVHLGAMAEGFVLGAQSERVIATAKHFAANSIEDTRFDVDVTIDERALHEVYLPHFERVVRAARVGAVMTAYNSVDGLHCDVNPVLLREILGERWGFVGFVMSDWLQGTHGDVAAVRAGLDVEMPSGAHFAALPSAVARGEIDEAEIDEALRGVLRAQLCFGLDVDPPVVDPAARETDAHLALAEEVARRGIVLVRNDGVLPIDRASAAEIVVMGPLADVPNLGDTGSSDVAAAEVVTALDGIVDRAGPVVITHVPTSAPTAEEQTIIAAADVVVLVIGLDASDEGEGQIAAGDRDDLALPPDQLALLQSVTAIGTPVVVVLEGGAPVLVSPWIEQSAAVMMAWYPGLRGGNAIADVLFGDAEPSGRLPVSVPVAEDDLPPFDNVSPAVDYGYLHGYRHLDANATAPALPFGFGLSYTSFAHEAIALDDDTLGPDDTVVVRVDVRNTGTRPGRETVQVYVGKPDSASMRAPKDLRGFAQIDLEPGAVQTVTIEIPLAGLRVWDPDAHAWVLEPGSYTVMAGPSSAELPLAAPITVMP